MAQTDLINEGLLADYHDELMKDHIVGGTVFDISSYHATGTPPVLAEYADLSAALGTNGANVPESMRKGGMSVKFVSSSDHKYVQARCMAQNFTTDVTQWQGVDDEPTDGSKNLVESGGVFDANNEIYANILLSDALYKSLILGAETSLSPTFNSGYVDINGEIQSKDTFNYCEISLTPGTVLSVMLTSGGSDYWYGITFYNSNNKVIFHTKRFPFAYGTLKHFIIPESVVKVRITELASYHANTQIKSAPIQQLVIDQFPAKDSSSLISSGGVFNSLIKHINISRLCLGVPSASEGNVGDYILFFGSSDSNNRIYKKFDGYWSKYTDFRDIICTTANGRRFYKASNNNESPLYELDTAFITTVSIFNGYPSASTPGSEGDFLICFQNNAYSRLYYYQANAGWKCIENKYFIDNVIFVLKDTKRYCRISNGSLEYISPDISVLTEAIAQSNAAIEQNTTDILKNTIDIRNLDDILYGDIIGKEVSGTPISDGLSDSRFFFDVIPGNTYKFYVKENYTGRFSIYTSTDGTGYVEMIVDIENTNFSDGVTTPEFTVPAGITVLKCRLWQTTISATVKQICTKQTKSNAWFDKVVAGYGDSVTALNGDDGVYPYVADKGYRWLLRVADYCKMRKAYNRGIGGTAFSWIPEGGTICWCNTEDGVYVRRDTSVESYTYDDYLNPNTQSDVLARLTGMGYNPTIHTLSRSCLSSWLRIITMFPSSIKDSIDVVLVMAHNDTSRSATLSVPLAWEEGSVVDTEWANSSYYDTYGGDYNINGSLEGAIASTIMKIQAWMPQALIVLMTPISGRGEQGELNVELTDAGMQAVADGVRDIHKLMSIPMIDMYANDCINGLNRTTYISDTIHPYTVAGSKMLARVICGEMNRILPKDIFDV